MRKVTATKWHKNCLQERNTTVQMAYQRQFAKLVKSSVKE